jgi:hypothetical protein
MAYSLYEDDTVSGQYRRERASMWAEMALDVYSWKYSNSPCERNIFRSIDPVLLQPPAALRIIFAPLDLDNHATTESFLRLATSYGIPQTFLMERLQSVPHSFSSRKNEDGSDCMWFHFLCKYISVKAVDASGSMRYKIANEHSPFGNTSLSESDDSWMRAGFFLRVDPPGTLRNASPTQRVTLLCFGASQDVVNRLKQIKNKPSWESAVADPFVLLTMIVNALYFDMDRSYYNLKYVFGDAEAVSDLNSSRPNRAN